MGGMRSAGMDASATSGMDGVGLGLGVAVTIGMGVRGGFSDR